jgi:hypothetical protein
MDAALPTETDASAQRRAFLVLVCTSAPSFMLQLDANMAAWQQSSLRRCPG